MRHTYTAALRAVASAVLVLAFVLGYAAPTLAVGGLTGGISGTVTDASTKAPVSGAAVLAVSPTSRYTATTDARGFFQINGVNVDTYTVSISRPGFQTSNVNGVTVAGGDVVSIGAVTLEKQLQKIGQVAVRSQSSAFQPNQTTDTVTVSGQRVTEATGKAASTSETNLALSVPGVQTTNAGRLTIRGGRANEVGYQLDGVNFTEPFLNRNASTNRFNGLGQFQVVAGAGDASQGNVGGGVINTVIKRGARPPFGFLDFESGAPNYFHQFAFEYGFATPDNRFSNYTAYNGQRLNPTPGNPAYGFSTADVGAYYGTQYQKNDDLIDNFVFHFGRQQSQSLQVLYQTRDLQSYTGTTPTQSYYPYNPYVQNAVANAGVLAPPGSGGFASDAAFFANRVELLPGVPGSNMPVLGGEQIGFNPARFLKFEYDNSLNASTYAALRYYNWEQTNGGTNYTTASTRPNDAITGGNRLGVSGELTHTFSEKHTAQIGFLAENAHPLWTSGEPLSGYESLGAYEQTPLGPGAPVLDDFVNPKNLTAPISAANPCPVPVLDANGNDITPPGGDPNGCYLYRSGLFNGTGVPRVPGFGINYNGTDLRQFAGFIQDTWTPNRFLRAQFGLREDVGNFSTGQNPFYPQNRQNPTDVDPATVTGFFVQPHFLEPRASLGYTNRESSIRIGYGRSVQFPEAQTFGTPGSISGLDPRFFQVTPKGNTTDPATWNCGSGYNPQHLVGGTFATAPNGGVGSNYADGGVGGYFQCSSYAQQIFWLYDQQNDAPDVGNNKPESQSNTDLTLQHQFRNGLGARLTAYYRHGFDVANFLLLKEIDDPVTGAPITQVFGVGNVGTTKTSGLELGLTTPQRTYGLSAYLSATYTNALSTVPPLIAGEDNLPLVSKSSIVLGNLYRAGYISPLTVNAGAQYKFRNGFRVNPILNYDRGYPIGVGLYTATGGRVGGTINGQYYNIPQTNLGLARPAQTAANGSAGAVAATQYVDPVNPGNYFSPYIGATRGTPETGAAGGYLSRPRLYSDISLEYQQKRNTFGVLVTNLFSNIYSEPLLNPYWQPVANGVGGPNTGKNASGQPNATPYIYTGFRNYGPLRYGNQPYVEIPNQAPLSFRFYYQLAL